MTHFRALVATLIVLAWIGASPVGVVAAIIHYYRSRRYD